MRALILVVGTTLALAGCRNSGQVENNMSVDENLTAESIVANDITAIDAVTGDASNMAADVEFNAEQVQANTSNDRPAAKPASRSTTPPAPKENGNSATPAPASAPAASTAATNTAD